MNPTLWTAARFPDGSWSTGGKINDPAYAECTVYQVEARSHDEAKKKGQAKHRSAMRKALKGQA